MKVPFEARGAWTQPERPVTASKVAPPSVSPLSERKLPSDQCFCSSFCVKVPNAKKHAQATHPIQSGDGFHGREAKT